MKTLNFKKLITDTPSNWKEKVEERYSKPWLNEYSSQIARRISIILEENAELNQTKLAQLIGVEKQYISRIIKGQENLSLQTIWKLSKALGVELINFPDYRYSVKMGQKPMVEIKAEVTTVKTHQLQWVENLKTSGIGLPKVSNESNKPSPDLFKQVA